MPQTNVPNVATGSYAKRASDQMPYCKDQGIDHLCGAGKSGVFVQAVAYTMAAGGVVNFYNLGLKDMADGTYVVLAQNTTGSGVPKIARDATRTAKQFVVTGPTNGDVLDIVIVGALSGAIVGTVTK